MFKKHTLLFAAAEQAVATGGAPSGKGQGNLADLLKSADSGIFVSGMLMVVEAPRTFKGTAAKSGKPYEFTQRRLEVFANKKMISIVERLDPENGHTTFDVLEEGQKVHFRVIDPRLDNGQIVFQRAH